jgi:hypothetical protein
MEVEVGLSAKDNRFNSRQKKILTFLKQMNSALLAMLFGSEFLFPHQH